MAKLLVLTALLLGLVPAYAQKKGSKGTAKPQTTYELADALRQKLVAITVEGTGGHQGESLKISCRNLAGRFLRLQIPQGQLMKPADSSMQTLVVSVAQSLALQVRNPAAATLKTFCTQAGARSPAGGTAFSIGAMAPDKVLQLLRFMSEKGKLDSPEAQSAMWCVTSGDGLSSISDGELLAFTAKLLDKKPPGYHVRYESREIPGERADLGKAMVVESNYRYTLAKDDYLSLLLLDANDQLIKVLRKDEKTTAGEHRSSLRLEVWNLDPGEYKVRLQKKDGTVIHEMVVRF